MKCKSCKKTIPDGSNYCNWCGVRQARAPRDELSVPQPRQLPSGRWYIQLRAEGESVTEDTAAKCIAKAKAIRAGFVKKKKATAGKLSLGDAMDNYLSVNSNILSPSTLRGYNIVRRNRFQDYMDVDIHTFNNWQVMLNDETNLCAAKTLRNAWGFVGAVMRSNGLTPPSVKLPRQQRTPQPWLSYEEIPRFLEAIRDDDCELGALLALNSLRRSELCAVTPDHVAKDGSTVLVAGAIVPDMSNTFVHKKENKTSLSNRTVPILIPRLQDLLCRIDRDSTFIVTIHPDTLRKRINAICEAEGLPLVGVHGLRRSFASLGYHLGLSEQDVMLIGGWDDYQTVHKHYLYLAENDRQKSYDKMTQFFSQQ